MTIANPAFYGTSATSEGPEPKTHRRRGKRFFILVVIATAIGFVAAKMRGHSSPDLEDDYGD